MTDPAEAPVVLKFIAGKFPVPEGVALVTPFVLVKVHAKEVTKGAERFDVNTTGKVVPPEQMVWLVVVLVIDGIGLTVMVAVELGPGQPLMVADALTTAFTGVKPLLTIVHVGIVLPLPVLGVIPVNPLAVVLQEMVAPLTFDDRLMDCEAVPEHMVWLGRLMVTAGTGCMVMVVSTGSPAQPLAVGVTT